ncbi:box A-binding factor [Scaptodrosophila lebanonensis]|uniref:Box A-binding factor n=1 Tax=Drosophila lebanonensis TaxID=7225 RepID=A0A6J2TEY7_DROLE|nr:box A-binding factor [Scaptodrosophila lebanonensis]
MERGTSGGQQHEQYHQHQSRQHHQQQQQQHHHQQQHQQGPGQHQHVVAVHSYDPYMTSGAADEEHTAGSSSFDNPATKKKPPKLKAIHRSLSMAIDNYAPLGEQMLLDDGLIIEQPLIHRSASPLPLRSAPPQTLALPAQHLPHPHGGGGGGSGAVSPALSARQQHHHQQQHHQQHQQQQHLHTFQHLAAQAAAARHHQHPHRQHTHSSSTSSPTSHSHAVSPVLGSSSSAAAHQYQQHQPDIYLVSSSSLGEDVGGGGVGSGMSLGHGLGRSPLGGSTSPIQFIDVDDMLPPSAAVAAASAAFRAHAAASSSGSSGALHTHPLKKNLFRRSDTIDVHPSANFQMKKTHSFHAQQDPAAMEQILQASSASAASSRRTSSVRANFLMPGPPAGKELSRSPSPSRRGCRSHRSFNDPARRPSTKPDSVVESQIRHPSLNDDVMDPLDGRPTSLFPQSNLSLENELFVESRSRSNSHTKMEDLGVADMATVQRLRKSSGSFEESGGTVMAGHSATHPPSSSNSVKQKRETHPHSRQQSTHSLELDGRPSTSSAAHTLQLHSAAAAATAAYHFKRGAQHGRSLYLSPSNLEELTVHRPGVLAAAAAFQGTNASASVKQAKALHSASMRLRTYRETLSASKKSKSFIGDTGMPGPSTIGSAGEDFELTSPHRRNSRPLSTAVPTAGASLDEIKRSPRPISAAAAAFIDEKRPSFERKPSLTYELSDAAFAAQVLRPFHHKLAAGRKASVSGGSHKLKKKSLSDDTDEDEDADRKRKRIVCIVLATVLLCLVCASIFVVVVTLTSGQSQSGKKTHSFSRDTPVHYTGMRPS